MYDKFINLADEKKESILTSALKEFAVSGYDKASTDVIAQQAKISKGSLFNYFNNKLGLYLYILRHCVEIINATTLEEISKITECDFYDRLKHLAVIKHRNVIKYPLETQIIGSFLINSPIELNENTKEIEQYNKVQRRILQDYLLEFLDESKLREGISKEDVIFITFTLLEALIKRDMEMRDVPDLCSNQEEAKMFDFDKYVNVLKYGIYKQE